MSIDISFADNKETRKSVYHENIRVWDENGNEYIIAYLGATTAKLTPVAGGPNVTVAKTDIEGALDAPKQGECDCCGRMTHQTLRDRETGLHIFRHRRCDRDNHGAL